MNVTPQILMLVIVVSITTFAGVFADEKNDTDQKKRGVKVSIIIRGAHCDEDVKVLRSALKKMKGIRFKPDDMTPGQKPRYFSDPFIVDIADTEKTNIGALAKAVSEAKTPHRKEFPLKVNLVLYTSESITEDLVVSMRSELMDVNGVEVLESGGLGAFLNKGYYWIQLENAGGAALKEILDAAKKADTKISIKKP